MNLQSLIKTLFYRAGYSIKRIRPFRRQTLAPAKPEATDADILHLIHRTNPYTGFDFESYPPDTHGWGDDSDAFAKLIAELEPKLIIEVGTWKGASAIRMATALRTSRLPAKIVCVDTWLGALEFWTDQNDPTRYQSLALRHGYPSVYYQFLANVCRAGLQDVIVPFPQTAATAALWFRYYGIVAELIYIDASHEEEDVYQDIRDYWTVLARDGVLFGDDYSWDGVRLAVDRFAREERLHLEFLADKWVLRKKR